MLSPSIKLTIPYKHTSKLWLIRFINVLFCWGTEQKTRKPFWCGKMAKNNHLVIMDARLFSALCQLLARKAKHFDPTHQVAPSTLYAAKYRETASWLPLRHGSTVSSTEILFLSCWHLIGVTQLRQHAFDWLKIKRLPNHHGIIQHPTNYALFLLHKANSTV